MPEYHGERLGRGTYDHRPVPVTPGESAEQPWVTEQVDPPIATALALLPEATRFVPAEPLNGGFSMTPDNLPLLGAVEHVAALWPAEAIQVTHAAGSAAALAVLLRGEDPGVPTSTRCAASPGRTATTSPAARSSSTATATRPPDRRFTRATGR
ncbi:hypothetical protein AB0F91_43175 [Amycolatopsis sp. NPDC023774]|uniref:hypothetical protein n=1 Tax=Amycolatopsis sp. NPDC023774 TaxID=3155015 RepID=UPI0033FA10CE